MLKTTFLFSIILTLISFIGISQGSINEMQKILIRNVTVIHQSGNTEDVLVNILIDQKNLELVTKDNIALSEVDIALDAKGGFIFGKLEVGSSAGFIILSQDPRLNVAVLIDTKTYAVFAVSKGQVVLNKLLRVDSDPQEKSNGWRNYSPPAVALPLSYQNKRKWNVFRTKYISGIFGGGILLENTRWLSQDANNEQQVGDLNQYKGGSVRGIRLGVGGTFNFKKPWTYFFSFATRAFERGFDESDYGEFLLFDYRLNIPIGSATLSLGKIKETFSLSRLGVMIAEPSQQERASVVNGLLPFRNIGIAMNNSFLKDRMTWAAGVFNDWYEVGQSFSNNPTVFTGRLTALPFLSEDESNLLHLGLAGRYSNGAGGVRYRTQTEIFSGPLSVDTEFMEGVSSTFHYGIEMAWRKGPFVLMSEYIQSNVYASTYQDPSFHGFYAVASYVFTGEMRAYNKRSATFDRVHVAKGINAGGWGELEAYARYSSIDLNDKSIDGGKMNTISIGVNWAPVQDVQFSVNYRYSTLDRFQQIGSNHGVVSRLAIIIE